MVSPREIYQTWVLLRMPRTHNSSIWIALDFLRSATNPHHFTQWMFMNIKAKLVDVFDIHYPIIYTFTDVCLISKPSWRYMVHIPNILILPSLLPYILILPCQDLHGLKRKPGAIRNSAGWRTWINWCEKARRWIQAASQKKSQLGVFHVPPPKKMEIFTMKLRCINPRKHVEHTWRIHVNLDWGCPIMFRQTRKIVKMGGRSKNHMKKYSPTTIGIMGGI